MDKFKVGDEIHYEGNMGNEVIEDINEEGQILGRCCGTNILSDIYARPENYTLIKRGGTMNKYNELKDRIEALDNGWDKDADDILQELMGDMKGTFDILITAHLVGRVIIINNCWDFFPKHIKEYSFEFGSQCSKMIAFKDALLWLLDHSDIKKDLVGQEVKAEIEGKIYKVRVLHEETKKEEEK